MITFGRQHLVRASASSLTEALAHPRWRGDWAQGHGLARSAGRHVIIDQDDPIRSTDQNSPDQNSPDQKSTDQNSTDMNVPTSAKPAVR
jgi:hypothetical protein